MSMKSGFIVPFNSLIYRHILLLCKTLLLHIQAMATRKNMTVSWTIVLIACVIFPFSTAFSLGSKAERSPALSPGMPISSSPNSPPEYSPPLCTIQIPAPSAPPSLPPAPASMPPYMPPIPASLPSYMPPIPASLPPYMPPIPASIPPYMPPIPASMPSYMPPIPASMPSYMPPMPASMPSYMPPIPASMPSYMPPIPALTPPPSPSCVAPTPPQIPVYPPTTPPPMPDPMPPYPSPIPSPMPPPPAPSMPPMPAYTPPSPPSSSPPPVPAPIPPPSSPIPSPIPPFPFPVPSPMPNPMPPTPPNVSAPPPAVPISTTGIKGGYWPSSLAEKYPPSTIPTKYFTHLFYAFVFLDPSTYQLSITQHDQQWMANFTSTLHSENPPAKAFLSIGGGPSSPYTFSNMASNSANRSTFIKSTVRIARKYGFDGLDLDWEFPNTPEDMSNLSLLLKEWRAAVEYESKFYRKPRLLLSAAVYFSAKFFLSEVPRTYPGIAINDNLDFVNPMCFDYHGSWDTSVTGEHALLFDNTTQISTSYGISSWKNAGVPPEKLVLGLPLYGRTWKLKNPGETGIGAPAVGVGPGNNGIMVYKDIAVFNFINNATLVYDPDTVSTYSYESTNWIGFDGPISIAEKIKYAKQNGLGGYFFWALGYDNNWILSETASRTWDC
ncbi:putative Chitinase [Melia azedarach]|uniref:Chitinase n=1 Tax=Melia azedarach TaxID=155640 RepID=A0ACC1XE00_MELAZ|nr:putative Chitinase [Melia azedarach]